MSPALPRDCGLATRHGSSEAAYRLARLLLRQPDATQRAEGVALSARAAQFGHARASADLEALAVAGATAPGVAVRGPCTVSLPHLEPRDPGG